MRFLLDENFPKAAAGILRSAGHEVFDFRGTADEGIDDETVFRKAKEFGAVLLTTDRDFFHTIPHLHDTHCGVIVIALRQPNRAAILSRLNGRFRKSPKRILQTGCSNCGTRPGWPIHQ